MVTTEKKKANPNYEATAVNLCNPPDIAAKLAELHAAQSNAARLDAVLRAMPEFEDMRSFEKKAADLTAEIKGMVDVLGSYQNVETGVYAVKQKCETLTYRVDLVRQNLDEKSAFMVIVEAVDVPALEALVKGGRVSKEGARACADAKEYFKYIVR